MNILHFLQFGNVSKYNAFYISVLSSKTDTSFVCFILIYRKNLVPYLLDFLTQKITVLLPLKSEDTVQGSENVPIKKNTIFKVQI